MFVGVKYIIGLSVSCWVVCSNLPNGLLVDFRCSLFLKGFGFCFMSSGTRILLCIDKFRIERFFIFLKSGRQFFLLLIWMKWIDTRSLAITIIRTRPSGEVIWFYVRSAIVHLFVGIFKVVLKFCPYVIFFKVAGQIWTYCIWNKLCWVTSCMLSCICFCSTSGYAAPCLF